MPLSMCKMCGFTSLCICGQWRPLSRCAGWSGPLLSAYAQRHIFAWHSPLPPTPTNFAWLESSFITTSGSSSSSSKSEVGAGLLKYYDKITQAVLGFDEEMIKVKYTVFNLITAHTPLSTLSSNSLVFKLQPVYFYLLVFKSIYIVGIQMNRLDKSRQFKWEPTTYAFIKKIRKEILHRHD